MNLPSALMPAQGRSAIGTRQRLGVKTAIQRVVVLGGTVIAQCKAIERGIRTIVRKRANQRVARSALRAVDEWVAIAPRRWVAQLIQTFIASEQVRGNVYFAVQPLG